MELTPREILWVAGLVLAGVCVLRLVWWVFVRMNTTDELDDLFAEALATHDHEELRCLREEVTDLLPSCNVSQALQVRRILQFIETALSGHPK